MRIVCISDTHSLHRQVKVLEGDLLIHAGDFSGHGERRDVIEFNDWLGDLDFERIIVTPGNHDLICQDDPELARKLLTNASLHIDEQITFRGLKIYLSPWTPQFFNWAFMRPRHLMKEVWAKMPDQIDILVTHGPPAGILDLVDDPHLGRKVHAGCSHLRNRVFEVKPKIHIFGHLHEGYGQDAIDGIRFINASNCTRHYRPTNPPIVIDI